MSDPHHSDHQASGEGETPPTPAAHDQGAHATGTNRHRLLGALLLTAGFMVVEAVGGWWSGSLALLADAGHMLTDTFALGLAWLAVGMARRPPDAARTYGYHRIEVLTAFVNGLILLAVVGGIYYEALSRLFHPEVVNASDMLLVATLGLLANLGSFFLLHGDHSHSNLNRRAALLHVISDLLGSIATIIASLIIMASGWMPIDPLLSMFIGLLILRSTWRVLAESGHVLLEAAPTDLDVVSLRRALEQEIPGVIDVHHVHVWSLTPDRPLLTMHLRTAPESDSTRILKAVKRCLRQHYGITHSAVQIESGPCPDGDADHPIHRQAGSR